MQNKKFKGVGSFALLALAMVSLVGVGFAVAAIAGNVRGADIYLI